MTKPAIPIVDIRPYRENDPTQSPQIVDTIRQACEDIGFFIITGHAVSDELIDRMYQTSRAFFDLPAEQKARTRQSGDALGGLMYFPPMAESLAASLQEKTPGDLKESLDYGPGFFGDEWPDTPANLRAIWLEYYQAMSELSACLREIFALAIGLPKHYFDDFFDHHYSSLRVLNYPPQTQAPLPGQLRAGAHSDYGFLTILRSEGEVSGLQARHRNGEWIDVPTVEGAFVVNIGDAMMRWTNDGWVSTVHRVINPSSEWQNTRRRQSIPFFHNPNTDALITCLEAFCDNNTPARYKPIRYGEYAALKYRQTHGADLK